MAGKETKGRNPTGREGASVRHIEDQNKNWELNYYPVPSRQ